MTKHQHISIDNTNCLCTQQVSPKLIFLMKTNLKYNWLLRKYDLIIQVSLAMEKLQECKYFSTATTWLFCNGLVMQRITASAAMMWPMFPGIFSFPHRMTHWVVRPSAHMISTIKDNKILALHALPGHQHPWYWLKSISWILMACGEARSHDVLKSEYCRSGHQGQYHCFWFCCCGSLRPCY